MTACAGLLNLDKPAGITSHKAVVKLRRILGVKRIGHGGTLDPLATGVLPILVGEATRLMEFLAFAEKHYEATVLLGTETDTQDAEGRVMASRPVPEDLTPNRVTSVLEQLTGEILQAVPAFSAVRQNGRRLYELAREGKPVNAPPRKVHIHRLTLTSFAPPELSLDIVCGKGTYIRQLAADLGDRIGCGAHLTALRRIRVGELRIKQAVTLEAVEQAVDAGSSDKILMPMHTAVPHLPMVRADRAQAKRLAMGQRIPEDQLVFDNDSAPIAPHPDALAAIRLEDGDLVAVVRLEHGHAQPVKVFPSQLT